MSYIQDFRNTFIVHLQFIVHFQLFHFIKNNDPKYMQFDDTVLQMSFKKCWRSALIPKVAFQWELFALM